MMDSNYHPDSDVKRGMDNVPLQTMFKNSGSSMASSSNRQQEHFIEGVSILSLIQDALPKLEQATALRLQQVIHDAGPTELSDLQFLNEGDFNNMLKPLQCRRLVHFFSYKYINSSSCSSLQQNNAAANNGCNNNDANHTTVNNSQSNNSSTISNSGNNNKESVASAASVADVAVTPSIIEHIVPVKSEVETILAGDDTDADPSPELFPDQHSTGYNTTEQPYDNPHPFSDKYDDQSSFYGTLPVEGEVAATAAVHHDLNTSLEYWRRLESMQKAINKIEVVTSQTYNLMQKLVAKGKLPMRPTTDQPHDDCAPLLLSPARSVEELDALLENDGIIDILKRTEDTTLSGTLRAMLKCVMDRQLAVQFSFTGMGAKRQHIKFALRNHKLYDVLLCALHETCYRTCQRNDINSAMKNILKNAVDWNGHRNRRRNMAMIANVHCGINQEINPDQPRPKKPLLQRDLANMEPMEEEFLAQTLGMFNNQPQNLGTL